MILITFIKYDILALIDLSAIHKSWLWLTRDKIDFLEFFHAFDNDT